MGLLAQAGGSLRQSLGLLRFVARGGIQASAHCGPVADGSPIARLPLGSIQIPFRAHNTYKGAVSVLADATKTGIFSVGDSPGTVNDSRVSIGWPPGRQIRSDEK